jgi:hypothetical protein
MTMRERVAQAGSKIREADMSGPDEEGYGELNTNYNPPTVQEVIDWLRKFEPDRIVAIYEGEGGDWLQVLGRRETAK